jgi:hypothetical protein
MIIITPTAGMCNRMRALDSALALGQAASTPVRAIWRLCPDLNCRFERLFEPLPGLESIEYREERRPAPSENAASLRLSLKKIAPLVLTIKCARRAKKTFRNFDPRSRVIEQIDTGRMLANPERLVEQARRFDLYIDTFDRFFYGRVDFEDFRPIPALMQRIDAFHLKQRSVVGVHVRRTDHLPAYDHSPTSAFIQVMEAEIERDPAVEFFLSTDTPEIETQLDVRFPGKILRQTEKVFGRDLPEGIEDAVVDLFCLASCRKVVGTCKSSFSETAASIHKIPLEVIDVIARPAGKPTGAV